MILPFLLHHANRTTKSDAFYKIKDHLLRNSEVVGYDIQFIDGKECHSCDGTGVYHKHYNGEWHKEDCWHCINGWYKRPTWVLLERKKFGKYIFHKPIGRKYGVNNPYKLPDGLVPGRIDGYVDHRYTRYGYLAVLLLFLVYDRKSAKEYFHSMGIGWRSYWYYPMNWLYVIAHFVYYGKQAYPLRRFRERWRRHFPLPDIQIQDIDEFGNTQLPF